jgi:hypothetical protein
MFYFALLQVFMKYQMSKFPKNPNFIYPVKQFSFDFRLGQLPKVLVKSCRSARAKIEFSVPRGEFPTSGSATVAPL